MEMKWKLETEMEIQPLSFYSPRKIQFLFLGIPELSSPSVSQAFAIPIFHAVYWHVLGATMVGNKAIVPRCLFRIGPGNDDILCFTYCKTESGRKFRNEAARVGMLAFFQDQVKFFLIS